MPHSNILKFLSVNLQNIAKSYYYNIYNSL